MAIHEVKPHMTMFTLWTSTDLCVFEYSQWILFYFFAFLFIQLSFYLLL